MKGSRADTVSSFTIIKGALIDETYTIFRHWNHQLSGFENLRQLRDENVIGATSAHWARDVAKVINRRFDPSGRDRPLVDLAIAGCGRDIWDPLLLLHMTRDEFLVRDFLVNCLYPLHSDGAYAVRTAEVVSYLKTLPTKKSIDWSGAWTESTTERVASGLLRIAADFQLLSGSQRKHFTSYHLPDDSFLYILHAMAETQPNARRLIKDDDWRMYLMDATDVERELLRLHQFGRLRFDVAGSLAQLELPYRSLGKFARELSQ